MKKSTFTILFLAFVLISISLGSCMASKKGNCGCPTKKGLVGY